MISTETKLYDNEGSFVADMHFRWHIGDTHKTEEIIEHEKNHYKIMEQKGYTDIKYQAIKMAINLFFTRFVRYSFRVIPKEKINPKDLSEICLGPENPSFTDKFFSSRIGNLLYSISYKIKGANLL